MQYSHEMIGERVIFHIDCNGFYASVEETIDPRLKQVPMAICGDPNSRKGIILAKNELAKGFGIQTAETIWQAKKKCPHIVLRPARHPLYTQYCEKLNAIYEEYTDQVERYGRDESYLDVTGSINLFGGDPVRLAHEIRKRIPQELGLTVSIGVSFNKIFAKMGSDFKKPNAVTVITQTNFQSLLWPLPIHQLFTVGKSSKQKLNQLSIRTIGDLATANPQFLERKLQSHGLTLYEYANGRDFSPVKHVTDVDEIKSVGNGRTFPRNLTTQEDQSAAIIALSELVAFRLRSHKLKCHSVQITIKDPDFKVITRQMPLSRPTWLACELIPACKELLSRHWQEGRAIRLLTITAQKLILAEEAVEQINLFESPMQHQRRKKQQNLEQTLDLLRQKHGTGIVASGRLLHNDLGLLEDESASQDDSDSKTE